MTEFEFSLDPCRRLLTVVVRGFWDAHIYRAYDAQLRAELTELRRLPAPRACLVDCRDFAVQTMEIANMMRDGVADRLSLYPERTARLVARAISRGQAARMTSDSSHHVFEDLEPAMDWLLGADSAPVGVLAGATAAIG